jgi:hypothetical protein
VASSRALLFLAATAFAQTPPALKIIETRCAGCHSPANKQSGLDLTTRDMALRGGDRGPAIVPNKSQESFLFQVISHTAKPAMPKFGAKLSDAEIQTVAQWIDEGAPWSNITKAAVPKHWAYQKPIKQTPPPGPVNPIDALIAAKHQQLKLTPVGPADPHTLIRRAYLDLLGVPPTSAETALFLKDQNFPAAIDRLLADRRYGERWGRHWMDIWRYSDWYGYNAEIRNSQKHIWRWRDWIVESLNNDKPYDRMIVEMLAGDEVAPADPDTVRATGFLARNYSKFDRDGWMQDAVDHTALAFLGTTVKCARCHDHKYDPISQEEYYRFRAFFEPYDVRTDRVPGEVDTGKDGLARIYDGMADKPTYLYIRGNLQNPDKTPLTPGIPANLGAPPLAKIEPVTLPLPAYYPDHRAAVHQDLLAQAQAATEGSGPEPTSQNTHLAKLSLEAAQAELPALQARIAAENAKYGDPPDPKYEDLAATARELERKAGILRGREAVARAQIELETAINTPDPKTKKADEKKIAEAQKKLAQATTALTLPATGYTPIGKEYPQRSTGRRTALANWIASKDNPLTARVAVNHIWARHFGQPLVSTVFDFGRNGKAPTNPQLLDYLAAEFMDHGWSMKKLHKLILTSAAYQRQSTAGAQPHPNQKIDPENIALWRMNPRRLEAEAVRDSILAVAGDLDLARGGPNLDPAKGFTSTRRSLYFTHNPDSQMEFLKTFDNPNPTECYLRNESVVPQQALALANSELSLNQAKRLAPKLTNEDFIGQAFETILSRPPTAEERHLANKFLDATANQTQARADFVHALFNHHDFVTIR